MVSAGIQEIWVNWISPPLPWTSTLLSITATGLHNDEVVDMSDFIFYQVSDSVEFTDNTELIPIPIVYEQLAGHAYIRLVYANTIEQQNIDYIVNDSQRDTEVYNVSEYIAVVDTFELTSIEMVFADIVEDIPVLGPPIIPPRIGPRDPVLPDIPVLSPELPIYGHVPAPYHYIPPGDITLPETWTPTLYRACMRSRLRYDGDSALLSDALLDEMALEAQRMIVEQLRWPLLQETLTHGSLAAFAHTPIYIKIGDTIYEPPVYPAGIDLTDITQDVTVYYLPNEAYIYLPEALWQAVCFLASALVLVQFENEKRELAYRRFAAERIASFSRQLKQNALANNTGTNSQYGITR